MDIFNGVPTRSLFSNCTSNLKIVGVTAVAVVVVVVVVVAVVDVVVVVVAIVVAADVVVDVFVVSLSVLKIDVCLLNFKETFTAGQSHKTFWQKITHSVW